MMVTRRVVTGVLSLLVLGGCRQHSHTSGAGSGDWGPVPGGFDAVRMTVSPNPAPKLATVTIDASASYGDITSFEFDFGDGSAHVTQSSPVITHAYDVVNYADTHYTVKVTGFTDANQHEVGAVDLLVKDLPPAIASLDSGNDRNAVIGEWIIASGKNFLGLPDSITVDGVPATNVVAIDNEHFKFRVPPTARAGDRPVVCTWTGYDPQNDTLHVKRYAVATSARYGKLYVMDISATEGATDTGIRLPITDASTVKISPDGSTAYVTNGRFNFATGTIAVVDLTADAAPVVHGTFNLGNGPLYAIQPAAKAPYMVAGDAFGIYLLDVSDPLAPVQKDYVSALFAGDPLNDIAAADIAVSPDGTKVAILNALDAQARIFLRSGDQFTNPVSPLRVNVGPKTQKAAISEDGNLLYVLGGGGEGAVPMDLSDPRAANITAVDITNAGNSLAPLMAGPYRLSDLNANNVITPVPFDLAISRSNAHKVYVTTLDQGFTTFFAKITTLVNNPSLNALLDLINFLATGGLNFGDTVPVINADTSTPSLGTPLQSTLTAPTAADMLYNDHKMLQSSFRLSYDNNSGDIVFETGATLVDNTTHASIYMPFETEALSFDAVFGLFTPPFSFGDVAFQP